MELSSFGLGSTEEKPPRNVEGAIYLYGTERGPAWQNRLGTKGSEEVHFLPAIPPSRGQIATEPLGRIQLSVA